LKECFKINFLPRCVNNIFSDKEREIVKTPPTSWIKVFFIYLLPTTKVAKTKKEKENLLAVYLDKISKNKGIIFMRPKKLTPNETNSIRKSIDSYQSTLNFVKNSVFRLALKEKSLPEIETLKNGENIVLFLKEDLVNPSKELKKFIEETKSKDGEVKLEILCGILDGNLIGKESVMELSEMPEFEQSISMILGILDNPISSVSSILENTVISIANILEQAFSKKE